MSDIHIDACEIVVGAERELSGDLPLVMVYQWRNHYRIVAEIINKVQGNWWALAPTERRLIVIYGAIFFYSTISPKLKSRSIRKSYLRPPGNK